MVLYVWMLIECGKMEQQKRCDLQNTRIVLYCMWCFDMSSVCNSLYIQYII